MTGTLGIDLLDEFFYHDQLYVDLSRSMNPGNVILKILERTGQYD